MLVYAKVMRKEPKKKSFTKEKKMSETQNLTKQFNVALDIKKSVSNNGFEVVEGDTENYINITLTDDGTPVGLDGCRIDAVFSHSGGTYIQSSSRPTGQITISGNTVIIHLNPSSFRRGTVECELRITKDNLLHLSTTPVFNFSCRPPLSAGTSVPTINQSNTLELLMQQTAATITAANAVLTENINSDNLHIMYSTQDPRLNSGAAISNNRSRYMGLCIAPKGQTPLLASEYTWIDTTNPVTISNASVSDDGNLVFTFSDETSVNTINIVAAVKDKLNISQAVTTVKNVSVQPSEFIQDSTYPLYPYKAAIACASATQDSTGSVTFNLEEAVSGNFAPIAEIGQNYVYIYCKTLPENTITIPCIRIESSGSSNNQILNTDI